MRLFAPAVLGLAWLWPVFSQGQEGAKLGPGQPAESAAAPAPALAPAIVGGSLIGKPPPPITVAKWVRGAPLERFEKGTVYVVDLWATWCGPCKAAIPDLTKLARQHRGKLEVIGVSISERQKDAADVSYIEGVEQFVAKMGDRMDYRVAVDTPDKQMHAAWLKACGTGGIPTAWVIDQQGLVAWIGIGTPSDLERIAGAVLAGTFDPKREAELQARLEAEAKQRSEADIAAAKERQRHTDERYPGYREAMSRGDQSAALASLNAAFKADPASETAGAYQWKLMLLMQRNKAGEVEAYARDLLARFPENDDIMGFVSACIVSTSEEPRFDKQLALEAARRAAELAKPDTRWAQFTKWRLGWACHHAGLKDQAVATMQSAVTGVRKLKGPIDFGNLEAECEEALTLFRKAGK